MAIDMNNIPEEMIIHPDERAFCNALGAALRDFRVARGLSLEQMAEIGESTAEYWEKYENAELQIPLYQFLPVFLHFKYPPELELTKLDYDK